MTIDDHFEERKRMVAEQIITRGIHNSRLLTVLESVPRHCFIPKENISWAYSDCPVPIGKGQTISQPYIVALMTDLLDLEGDETVLDVGTGSGYQAAVLSGLCAVVHTVEIITELGLAAQEVLNCLGYKNVLVHIGDGSLGWKDAAPYKGILVAAAAPNVPQPLLDQLKDGGRLVIPVGSRSFQELQVWERSEKEYRLERNIPVAFVPLRGEYGWQ